MEGRGAARGLLGWDMRPMGGMWRAGERRRVPGGGTLIARPAVPDMEWLREGRRSWVDVTKEGEGMRGGIPGRVCMMEGVRYLPGVAGTVWEVELVDGCWGVLTGLLCWVVVE